MAHVYAKIQTGNSRSVVVAWVGLVADAEGDALAFAQYADKSVQLSGDLGGASVVIEGSNNGGADWATLHDIHGNTLSLSGPKIEMVAEATQLIRPRVVGGDETTAANVHLLIKE